MPDTRTIFMPVSTRRRRVLHVIRTRTVAGAERHLAVLTRALRDEGWFSDVLVASAPGGDLEGYETELRAACDYVEVMPMRADASPPLLGRLRKALRTGRYAVVHTHLVHADWHAALVAGGRHSCLISTKHNHDPFRVRPGVRRVEAWATRQCDAVIAISASLSDFTERVTTVEPSTVPYGLPVEAEPEPPVLHGRPPVLLAAGRLEPQKGFDVLLAAIPAVVDQFPDVQLAIAGEGSQRRALEQTIDDRGLAGSVRLLGWRTDTAALLASATVFVHPARWEGFGLVLLEAMASARPVISTRVGAIPEVVGEASGMLTEPDDPAALAEAIIEVLSAPERVRTMGQAGLARVRDHFSPARMASQTAAVYRSALDRRALTR